MPRAATPPQLLRESDVCAILGVSRWTLLSYRRRHGLPFIANGRSVRYDPRALSRWIKGHEVRLPRSAS